MNRRDFLRVTFGAAGVAAAPVVLTKALEKRVPVIYGDGIHDDTEGLQAALSGREFIARNECVWIENGAVRLANGRFILTETLQVPKDVSLIGSGTVLEWRGELNAIEFV